MTDYTTLYQMAFSLCVIAVFGYRQFNQWTDAETTNEKSEPELLAFARPRSFTSLWRFLSIALLYCSALAILYFLIWALFSSPPDAGMAFLKVTGVTAANAWLVALLVVTGLSPILPVIAPIERTVREVMHAWAVVPTKAQQMADELASPNTAFAVDETFFIETVRPRLDLEFLRSDLVMGSALTLAQKWCRLKFLVDAYAPPSGGGADTSWHRSPYTTRFHNDLMSLQESVVKFAKENPGLLRSAGGTPEVVSLLNRADSMLHRLYVLMCCRAFESVKSVEQVADYLQRSYGIKVHRIELSPFPTDPVVDALFAVTVAVLGVSFTYVAIANDQTVHPLVWAISAFATHGLGLLVGWFVFAKRRARYRAELTAGSLRSHPLSRKSLVVCTVIGFALASPTTWLTALYQLHGAARIAAPSWIDLSSAAFQLSWPWAFLGSATAVAVYVHLERTSDREPSLGIRARSAAGQAFANVLIGLLILGLYAPPSAPTRTLSLALAQPVYQLVLLLTGTIGLVLGFFLPRVVYRHGPDRRGGAVRCRPVGAAGSAIFTYGGRQTTVSISEISLTGCVLQLEGLNWFARGRDGTLTLSEGTSLPTHFVRRLGDLSASDDPKGSYDFAMQFVAPGRGYELSNALRARLLGFVNDVRLLRPA